MGSDVLGGLWPEGGVAGRVHGRGMDSMEEAVWRGSAHLGNVHRWLRLALEGVECSGGDASCSSCVCSGSWHPDHCPCPSPRMWHTAVALLARSRDPLENCNRSK